jgi:short-subunit dehydrogenase
MTQIRGAAALITGAANGIGRALAHEFVMRGCDIAVADRDEAGLKTLAGELDGIASRRVTQHVVDVADRGQMQALAAAVLADHPRLNIVVNNAGVALVGDFHEIDLDDMQWVMGVNFWGAVYGTHFLLPHLANQTEAHIVNIAALFGLIAPPGQASYSAAKFALRGFSEALRHELEMAKSSVRLSIVYPGGVTTGIARSARAGARIMNEAVHAEIVASFDKIPQMSPQMAAQHICDGIERNKTRIKFGLGSVLIDVLQRLMPASYWKVMARGANLPKASSKSGGP